MPAMTLTVRDLRLIMRLLTAQAERIRTDAPAIVARQPHRLVREGMADIQEMAARNCDELAERLSLAVPGDVIHVTEGRR